ncbi:twitch domain-containing radical SAM protein [Azospirillum sp. sgz302134]
MTCLDTRPTAQDDELPSRSFCVLPWVQFATDQLGRVRPCYLTEFPLTPEAPDREAVSAVGPGGVEGAWNSAAMRRIRRDMLAGKTPLECRDCQRGEGAGMQPYRRRHNRVYADRIAPSVAATAEDGTAPLHLIRKFDLYPGNSCNLQCRMCSPVNSTGLIDEWVERTGRAADDPLVTALRRIDWYKRDDFRQSVEALLPQVDWLHFLGGEPFVIKQMYQILERAVELGVAGNITLSYNTNLTTLPKRLTALWRHFKAVSLTVSLDGVGPVNDLIRSPSRWEVVERNLKTVDREFKNIGVTAMSINTTIQVHGAFGIDAIVDYALNSFNHMDIPNLSVLSQPEAYSVQILRPEMKAEVAARLRRCAERLDTGPVRWSRRQVDTLLDNIEGIITHMMAADRQDLIPRFRDRCLMQDRRRAQRTLDVVPELAPLFE